MKSIIGRGGNLSFYHKHLPISLKRKHRIKKEGGGGISEKIIINQPYGQYSMYNP